MSVDSDGRHIRFSHCPGLSFPSMQYAFDYFHVQAKNHEQRVAHQEWLQRVEAALRAFQVAQRRLLAEQGYPAEHWGFQAGQLADSAAQQACVAKALCAFEPVRHLETPLKQIDAQFIAKIPMPPSHTALEFRYQHAAEPVRWNQWRKQDSVPASSRSSPSEYPPQTLFAESTPHAREIQARPRLKLPAKGLPPWSVRSKVTKGDFPLQSIPSTQVPDQAMTQLGSHHPPSTCTNTVLPQSVKVEVDTNDQPAMLHSWHPLPSSYADTVLPQTLNKKDRRVLGVSLSAGVSE